MNLRKRAKLKEEIPKKRCAFCWTKENLTYDHKKPKTLGGTDEPKNIQVLCYRCNSMKSKMTNRQVRTLARWIYSINESRRMSGKGPMGIKKSLVPPFTITDKS